VWLGAVTVCSLVIMTHVDDVTVPRARDERHYGEHEHHESDDEREAASHDERYNLPGSTRQ
jgi:hypothetical protein